MEEIEQSIVATRPQEHYALRAPALRAADTKGTGYLQALPATDPVLGVPRDRPLAATPRAGSAGREKVTENSVLSSPLAIDPNSFGARARSTVWVR
jgi:hypothetical protein